MHIELIVDEGPLRGTAARIKVGHYLVGRHDECQIRYDDSTISQRHCLLWNDGTKIGVSDLHSTLGTFVNGEKLEPHVWKVMQDSDLLRVGELSMRVVVRDADSHGPLASDIATTSATNSVGGVSRESGQAAVTESVYPRNRSVDYASAEISQEEVEPGTRPTHMRSSATTLIETADKDFGVSKRSSASPSSAAPSSAAPSSAAPVRSASAKKKPTPKKTRREGVPLTAWATENYKLIAMIAVAIGITSLLAFQTYGLVSGPQLEIRTGLD